MLEGLLVEAGLTQQLRLSPAVEIVCHTVTQAEKTIRHILVYKT